MGDELIKDVVHRPAHAYDRRIRVNSNSASRPLLLRAWSTAHSDSDLTVVDTQTGALFAGDLVFLAPLFRSP